MKRRTVICAAMTAVVLAGVAPAWPDEANLVDIMRGLRNDTVEVADGLLTGDLRRAAGAADRIAGHPQIPGDEVQRVSAELGPEMAAFKGFDSSVHNLAVSIAEAARAGDGKKATADFQEMLSGCFGCHAAYKDRISAALNNAEQ